MTSRLKRLALPVAALACLAGSPASHAWGLPVYDAANYAVSMAQAVELGIISFQLSTNSKGTVNYNTEQIDNSTKNIDKSTQNIDITTQNIQNLTANIDKSTMNIDKSTTNIDNTTQNILKYNQWNYDINAEFTWVINKVGDEVIPIPDSISSKLAAVKGDAADAEGYAANFQDAQTYASGDLPLSDSVAFEGSRARKAANDVAVASIEVQQTELTDEAEALAKLRDASTKAQGTGHHLQLSNALAGSQINQLMKLRSLLLASEASRAAESQAAADRDAQALATARHMREGLDVAMRQASRVSAVN